MPQILKEAVKFFSKKSKLDNLRKVLNQKKIISRNDQREIFYGHSFHKGRRDLNKLEEKTLTENSSNLEKVWLRS